MAKYYRDAFVALILACRTLQGHGEIIFGYSDTILQYGKAYLQEKCEQNVVAAWWWLWREARQVVWGAQLTGVATQLTGMRWGWGGCPD